MVPRYERYVMAYSPSFSSVYEVDAHFHPLVVAIVCHSTAVASTVVRLAYRWWMARFWWEDGWAALACVFDIVGLVSAVMVPPRLDMQSWGPIAVISGWMATLSLAAVVWAARFSVLFSIVRVGNPSKALKWTTTAIGCSFVIMFLVIEGQRLEVCVNVQCRVFKSTAISQLISEYVTLNDFPRILDDFSSGWIFLFYISFNHILICHAYYAADVIADLCLVALPIRLLRGTKLSWMKRILIQSTFSASMCITIVTIIHSVVLLKDTSSGNLLFGHFKAALSLLICNLLVIVTFIYRVCHKSKVDLEQVKSCLPKDLTTVDLWFGTLNTESNMNTNTNTNTNTYPGPVTDECSMTGSGSKQSDPMNEVTISSCTVAPGSDMRTQE
ncbi:hypothetical protein J3A83DRAFT_4158765 [Scleroderma citrinum]